MKDKKASAACGEHRPASERTACRPTVVPAPQDGLSAASRDAEQGIPHPGASPQAHD